MVLLRRVVVCAAGFLVACGSSTSFNAVGGVADGSSADSQAAQQSAQAGDDAASSDQVGANQKSQFFVEEIDQMLQHKFADISSSLSGTIRLGDCTANVTGTISVSDGNLVIAGSEVFTPSQCTGAVTLQGTETVNITISETNRVTDVAGTLTRTLATGDQVVMSQLNPDPAFMAELVATGSPASGAVMASITLNEHRVRSADGNVVFDHNITTPDGSSVSAVINYDSSGDPTSRTLVSGEIDLHHNLAHFLGKHTFNNLYHDLTGTCACPQSGALTQEVTADDGSWTFTRAYAFTDCGQATVTTSASTKSGTENGTATITWASCKN